MLDELPTSIIELTPTETLIIAQYIQDLVPDSRPPHVSLGFLLDFAIIFLKHIYKEGNLIQDAQPEKISLPEDKILTLRELIPVVTGAGTPNPVGLILHRKLYKALLRLDPVRSEDLPVDDE